MRPSEKWSGTDRRSSVRYTVKDGTRATWSTTLSGLDWNEALVLLNVSENGLCLGLTKPLEKGQVIEIGLLAPGWAEPLSRLGVVVWSTEAAAGTFRAGILLSRAFASSEMQALCQGTPITQ